MRLILLGPPAAGKGTQAAILSEKFGIPAISTGVIIRNAIREASPLGIKAKGFIDAGQLVPDDIAIDIVVERIGKDDCKNGYILDGFPRTVVQAKAFTELGITFDKVISLEITDIEVMKRITGRRECSKCGATYHVKYNPSTQGDKCQKCGGELITRKDDTVETVTTRLKVYHQRTEPLKAYYLETGNLVVVRGRKRIEGTTRHLLKALGD